MPSVVTVYELLLQVSLAGCVLLALASIAVMLLREPARKIRVIELAMLGLLALPLVALIPGYPRVPLLPAERVASEERVVPREMLDAMKNPPANPGVEREVASSGQPPALPEGRVTVDPIIQAPRVAAAPRVPTINHRESSTVASPTSAWQLPTDFRFWLVFAYLTGVGILCVWSLLGLAAMRRLVRSSHPADDATRSVLRAIAGDASDRVRLLVSARAAQPCAFGWHRPTIVLPESLIAAGDSAALRFALAHEWSHVTRGDIGTWTLSGLARLLHFHQPLVWLLRQHLRRSQDYLADAAAAGTATPEDYAEFLTSLSQNFKRPHLALGLGIVSRRSDLHRRVVMLVEKQGSLERVPPKRWNVAIVVAGLLAVATVASLRAEPNNPQPPTKAETQSIPPNEKESAGETAALSISPSNDDIEAVLAEDPQIRKLIQEQEALGMALRHSVVNGGTYNKATDNRAAYARVTQLSREIARVEQQIEERRAELRPSVIESLGGPGRRSAATLVQPLQDTQTQRFMLGEGVSIAQNQPTTAVRRAPFSGKIRPGDILNIEIAGGFPEPIEPRRTVEPDGNVAIGAAYGDKGRIQVAGKSLIEAGEHIEKELRAILKDPNVIVTYAGHDPDIVAEGEVAATTATSFPAAEPIVLAPLDTIDLHLPVKGLMLRTSVDGKLREVHTTPQSIDDVYIIEPDGNIALPFRYGRVNIKGMTEGDAGNAIRNHLTEQWMPRTGLPQVSVRKRGHAVFPADQPSADGRIRPGDSLLIGNQLQSSAFNYQVTSEGNLPGKAIVLLPDGQSTVPPLHVAGLSLAEAQDAIAKSRKDAIIVTIGGWHEEADPDVVAEGEADKTLNILAPPAAEPVVLAPLDTIEVRLGAKSDNLASVNGTYVIEPDGLIGLFNGRLKLAGLTELEAGNAIRTHFSQSQWQRKAPPSINVVRRGRAVFPAGKQPAADYRVRAGGLLLVNQNFSAADGTNYEVSADGMLQSQPDFIGQPYEPVHVAGLTLDEVQKRLCENWKARQKSGGEIWSDPQEQAWVVTIGGWHEEADPALIDRLGESADPRVQQLERELQQIKTMIHAQQR